MLSAKSLKWLDTDDDAALNYGLASPGGSAPGARRYSMSQCGITGQLWLVARV